MANTDKKGKVYGDNLPIIAMCYDFDKTLSPKDMQNFALIPKLGCEIEQFWRESDELAKDNGMDKILAYMKLIIDKAKLCNIEIKREDFVKLGESIELFSGVDTWFDRINAIAQKIGVHVEHYIISAGIQEIIEGTSIAKYFTEIYASSFLYDADGYPVWPSQVVNYTTKTQHLYRISKNCLDLSDEESVNEHIKDENRRIPFRNFIYFGDSETDIPAMRIVKKGGGIAIGVYNPETVDMRKVSKLLKQERINFLMPALYTEGSKLESLVENIIKKIKATENLTALTKQQDDYITKWESYGELVEYTESLLESEEYGEEELASFREQAKQSLNQLRKDMLKEFSGVVEPEELKRLFKERRKSLMKLFTEKIKAIKAKDENNNDEDNSDTSN